MNSKYYNKIPIICGYYLHREIKLAKVELREVADRFRRNKKGYWEEYDFLLILFLIALLLDAISTVHFMQFLGAEAEINPVVRFCSIHFGHVVGPFVGALGKAIMGYVLTVYLRKYAVTILVSSSILCLFASWYNIWGTGYLNFPAVY